MPRYARQRHERGIHHVVVQGKRLEHVFEKAAEKELYLETVLKYITATGVKLYAFCIMDNHVHLVLHETKKETVSSFMRRVDVSFGYWYRRRYDLRPGEELFRGRYLSEPLPTEDKLLEVVRHIHQEPVQAGLVKNMEEYPWSSYRLYLKPGTFIDRRLVMDSLHFGGGYTSYMKAEEAAVRFLEEVPVKYGRSDEEAEQLVQKRLAEAGFASLRVMDEEDKKFFLRRLRYEDEVSIQQLSRVTGISRGLIQRL